MLTEQFIQAVTPQQTGTHYPATSDRVVLSESMPLPPLAEQKRIVATVEALLTRVNAARERLAKVPAILRRFRQSVLAAACSGQLTADWRQCRPDQQRIQVDREQGPDGPFDLPTSWRWTRFEDLVASIRSGSTAVPKLEETRFPILRSSSVRPGAVDLADVRYVEESESRNQENFLRDADLLFTRLSGSVDYVANCAIVRGLAKRRIQYPDRLFRVRLHDARHSAYVERVFHAPFLRKVITETAKSSAGHQRVSQGDITNQLIPLPLVGEQAEIVRRVEDLFALADKIEARVQAATARVEKITQAILAKAFRGELVPTEAELACQEGRDYEPASVLLERIRAADQTDHGKQAARRRRRQR